MHISYLSREVSRSEYGLPIVYVVGCCSIAETARGVVIDMSVAALFLYLSGEG